MRVAIHHLTIISDILNKNYMYCQNYRKVVLVLNMHYLFLKYENTNV